MTKVISLSDDAYEKLNRMKRGNESFSELVRRFDNVSEQSFLKLAGSWKDNKEIEAIFKGVLEDRKKARFRV